MQSAFVRLSKLSAAALVAFACFACGDDDEPKRSKDAGSEKDAESDSPGMRIPRGGRSGNGGAGGAGGADSATAYTCVPKKADTGGPTESGGMCCGGKGTCGGASDTTSGLPHDTCKANPDLRCVPMPAATEDDAGMSA